MKRYSIDELKPGMIINQPIYDQHYTLLVNKGTPLNLKLIESIQFYGYKSVYIHDQAQLETVEYAIPLETMHALIKLIKKTQKEFEIYIKHSKNSNFIANYKKFIVYRDTMLFQLNRIADDIIIHLIKNKVSTYKLLESKSMHLYPIQHAIQTSMLSVLMGIKRGLAMNELRALFIAGIMIELSNVIVPKEILNKNGPLTSEEFDILKEHTQFCHQYFSDCQHLNVMVKVITQQHHEKYDGAGYPKRLKGKQIHPLAQLLSVADAFDALISDRSQRDAYQLSEAYHILKAQTDESYPVEWLQLLEKIIIPYEIGETLALNVGPGIVSGYDESFNPIVELLLINKHIVLSENSQIRILNPNG